MFYSVPLMGGVDEQQAKVGGKETDRFFFVFLCSKGTTSLVCLLVYGDVCNACKLLRTRNLFPMNALKCVSLAAQQLCISFTSQTNKFLKINTHGTKTKQLDMKKQPY